MASLNKDQEVALQFLKNWWTSESRFAVLQGAAGTGKTFLINYLVKVLPNCYPIFTAPTNEACRQLELALDKDCLVKTTYSLLGFSMSTSDEIKTLKQRRPLAIIDDYNLLIVDEASFVDETLFSAIEGTNLKILFIGHSKQLPGVDINLKEESTCESLVFFKDFPTYTLETPERASGDLYNFIASLETLIESKIKVFRGMYNTNEIALLDYIHSEEGKLEFLSEGTKLLCYTNKAVDNWNTVIRRSIFGKSCAEIVVKDKLILTSPVKYIGVIEEKASRQKLLNEKANAIQISTNTKLTVLKVRLKRVLTIDCHELVCETMDGKVVIYVPISKEQFNKFLYSLKSECFTKTTAVAKARAWETYHYIHSLFAEAKYSYAMTVHRSQGSTIPSTIVNWKDIQLCKNLTLRYKLLYVACSRAKTNLKIVL